MNTIIVDDDIFEKEFSCEIATGQHFIFDEFALLFGKDSENPIYILVNAENGIDEEIYFNLLKMENGEIKEIQYSFSHDYQNKYDGLQVYCSVNEERYTNIGHDLAQMVLRVIIYVLNAPRNKVIKESNNKPKTNKNKRNYNSRIQNKNVYLLSEIVEYENNNLALKNKSTRKISCDCWGVRGHYRHYKNGNVVFIKEYKKGKNRYKKEPQGKIYTV